MKYLRFKLIAVETQVLQISRTFPAQIVLNLLQIVSHFTKSRIRIAQSGRP